jgi:hypothetical protein
MISNTFDNVFASIISLNGSILSGSSLRNRQGIKHVAKFDSFIFFTKILYLLLHTDISSSKIGINNLKYVNSFRVVAWLTKSNPKEVISNINHKKQMV